MKRSGFSNKIRKPMKRSGFSTRSKSIKASKKPKLAKLSTLRNKCDSFLTPIIKLTTPHCEACGDMTQVGHHMVEKSRSSNLRYNLENLIALCNPCHSKIHNIFGNNIVGGIDVAQAIIMKRGRTWYERMKVDGRKIIPVNRAFYEANYTRLNHIYQNYPLYKSN